MKRVRVSCTVYVATVAASSFKGHTESQHGRSPPQRREVEIEVGGGKLPMRFPSPCVLKGEMPSVMLSGSST